MLRAKKEADNNDSVLGGFSPEKKGVKKKPNATYFAAWDDAEQHDIDFTTEQVLAETGPEGTFDILAERGYETLLDYHASP